MYFVLSLLIGGFVMAGDTHSKIYDISLKTIDGKETNLSQYKGKVMLIVNTASKCGYTPQYEGLEKIYEKFKDKGLVVLGFPSNDFGGQEPGSNEEVKKFCQLNYGVKFPLFAKGVVKGGEKQPLFTHLLESAPSKDEIKWNFEKFLVSKDGKVIQRFGSKVKPEDTEMIGAIEKSL